MSWILLFTMPIVSVDATQRSMVLPVTSVHRRLVAPREVHPTEILFILADQEKGR